MKSSKIDIGLELDCWIEELSPAQLAAYEKVANEHNAIKNSLKTLMGTNEGKELFNGEVFSAYSFKGKVLQEIKEATVPKKPPPSTQKLDKAERRKRAATNLVYMESSDDDEDNIPLAKRVITPPPPSSSKRGRHSKGAQQLSTPQSSSKSTSKSSAAAAPQRTASPQLSPLPTKSSKMAGKSTPKGTAKSSVDLASQNFRPSEITSVGGLVIDSEAKDNKAKTSEKEGKLQGKTFPSLVVLAKPWLKVKDMSATRSKLDSKVKLVLMLTPNKFTEWLIQEGLLKSEQKCTNHKTNELKLGVYSDATKFPYSGGYVWISECCPTRFVSVFHGSLFEGAPNPPSCILKLIYHWSCQTNIQNVVQWVKVDNVYIKGVYTWLRAACTLAIHQKCKLMGGPERYVEVGVISLGTTSQDGQQRQVKVEVLGVLDYADKTIRLRAVEPVSDADRNYKKRFQTILEPLSRWVNKDSIIAIDLTVDKMTLYQMGFKNIVQAAANDTTAKHTNSSVMDYLRRIVPRMFQNTLSLLSRQMIQQFLDELVWREQFGTYALQAFNNITSHLAEQTRMNTGDTLTQRLYQVATNPFKDWSVIQISTDSTPSTSTTPKRLKKPINEADYAPTSSVLKIKTEKKDTPKRKLEEATTSSATVKVEKKSKTSSSTATPTSSKKNDKDIKTKQQALPEMKGLEELYYGVQEGTAKNFEGFTSIQSLDCPICSDSFDSNEKLQTHLVAHISIDGKDHQFQCLFCLEKHPSELSLSKHNQIMHAMETKAGTQFCCLICQQRHSSLHFLTVHMQKIHNVLELPYVCEACEYRSSSHRDLVRHFYDDHKQQNFLQCPLCLAIFRIAVKGELKPKNIEAFYMHLKAHLPRDELKKCPKCALSFHEKGFLKRHLAYHHQSNFKVANQIRTLLPNSALIEIPKTRSHHKEPTPYVMQTRFKELYIYLKAGSICSECDTEVLNEDHFIGQLKCTKCAYKTCCERAMFQHSTVCQNSSSNNLPGAMELPSEEEMHCVCGFSTAIGNKMARHLALCCHKSAYLSVENALENTVKRHMLDMLGLVRRDGEKMTDDAATDSEVAVGADETAPTTEQLEDPSPGDDESQENVDEPIEEEHLLETEQDKDE
ncbi:uncharacterized protein LOC129918093 [Episyrphus balteatus]|uniref:uncharacterized protein LOC129918093 n=1 Tax=Episyrphus balteatus TaxID=286459 RepID=UPI002484F85A|nr:uncharacterized protein LOC129918093 [Episyrphus balteatus]